MPGDYRLVIKGHDGTQIGVLDAYESLTYDKSQNEVGEALLVANYGVADANDALLDELTEDVILEVQRHPDLTDADLDWYVDWMGFCEPPEETITEVNTERKNWRFLHINRLVEQNLIHPPLDVSIWYHGEIYAIDRELYSGMPGNIMRQLVREQCVEPTDTSRTIQGLFVENNEAEPAYVAGWPGWVYADQNDADLEAVLSSYTWLGELVLGTEDESATRWQLIRTADGETWTNTYNGYPVWAIHEFDDGNERLYAAYGDPGWAPTRAGVYRSAALGWGGWAVAWNRSGTWTNVVMSLEEHSNRLYAGTGYGTYTSGGYRAKGQIWRCLAADGTNWSVVYEGNPGGVGTRYDKYLAFEALYSWNGYLYAGGVHYYAYDIAGAPFDAYLVRARILRSQTGDAGTWTVVNSVDGPTVTIDQPVGITTTQPQNTAGGFCCFAEFGTYLYAGIGDRWRSWNRNGEIWRTDDGTTWEKVFGAIAGGEHAEYAAPGVTWLATHGGAIWAGCGGGKHGDGQVWFSTDGTTWILAFDQLGLESMTCHTLRSFGGALYSGFGYVPFTAGDTFSGGYGFCWRATDDGWVPPDWPQEGGGNWTTVLEVLQKIADATLDTEGGTDFEIVPIDFGGDLQEFQFRSRSPWGADRRSTSADPTIFGVNRGNMANPIYRKRKAGKATAIYALGSGQGDNRTVLPLRNPEAESDSPWARWEKTLNIQGVDTPAELYQQANAVRQSDGPLEEFTFDILETPSTRYGAEWDVGDLVSAVHGGVTYHCKIMGVTIRLGTNPVVEQIDAKIQLLETA